MAYNVADAAQHAGHVAATVQGVMAQRHCLPRRAEDHLVVGTLARHADAVDRDTVVLPAPGVC